MGMPSRAMQRAGLPRVGRQHRPPSLEGHEFARCDSFLFDLCFVAADCRRLRRLFVLRERGKAVLLPCRCAPVQVLVLMRGSELLCHIFLPQAWDRAVLPQGLAGWISREA